MINRRHLIASAAGLAPFSPPALRPPWPRARASSAFPCRPSPRPAGFRTARCMVKEFTALGYETDLQYGEDDIPNQLAQIENMVTKGAKVLIIAAIDGSTLSDILAKAHEAGAKVFAYDRLITKTGNVDYYTTFDNFGVGVLQGNSLIKGLKERFAGVKPWNVELFGGSPDDTNAFYFYDGAMCGPPADDRRGRHRHRLRPDGHGQGRHAALGRRCCAGPHGQPAVGQLHRQEGAWRSGALRRPVARHHLVAQGRGLCTGTPKCRSSPARTPKCRRSRP